MNIQQTDSFTVGGRRAAYVLIICSLLRAISYADWQVMSVVMEPMKLDLGLSDAQAGMVSSAFFFGIIVCTLPVAPSTSTPGSSKCGAMRPRR